MAKLIGPIDKSPTKSLRQYYDDGIAVLDDQEKCRNYNNFYIENMQ